MAGTSPLPRLRPGGKLRRTPLTVTLVMLLALVTPSLRPAAAQVRDDVPFSIIGYSQGGRPLAVHHLGVGATRVLILGGQHGGPEMNTIVLAERLLDYFVRHPEEIPRGVGLDVLVVANPDGAAMGSRQFLSGVDPNRNWATTDWTSDAWDSNARYRIGLGGPEPFSEIETQALGNWIEVTRPALVINYHSAGGFMFGGRSGAAAPLAAAYEEATAYPRPGGGGAPGGGGGGGSPLPYRASGTMNGWLGQIGVPGILVELATPATPEYERNLAGVRAVLRELGARSVAAS